MPECDLLEIIASQKNLLSEQHALLEKKNEEVAQLQEQVDHAWEYVRLLKLKRFAPSSEKLHDLQTGFFNEAEVDSAKPEEEFTQVAAHKRIRGKRKPLADHLMREERVIELPPEERKCPTDGAVMEPIGREVSEKLEVVPAQVHVIRTIRIKYGCGTCCSQVKVTPVPPSLMPKGLATETTLATVVNWKFEQHLPLYRIENMLDRIGVDVSRGTLARWMVECGDRVQPLINLLEEKLLARGYVQMDETRTQVLKEEGKRAESQSYMWVMASPVAHPIVLFEYDPTRSGDVPKRLLGDFKGFLQADGYNGYDPVTAKAGITRLGCMAHCRRKFDEAKKAGKKPGLAHEALVIIAKLSAIETSIKGKSDAERKAVRDEQARPILAELRAFVDKHLARVPKASLLGKALHYTNNEWPYLEAYLQDGRLEINNNFVENAIRPFALGRKNWLFSDSVKGAKASANLYSIVVTARLNGLDIHGYLKFVFEGLARAQTADDIERLLPENAPESLRARRYVN